MVRAAAKTVSTETDRARAHARWRDVAESLRWRRGVSPSLEEAEPDSLASLAVEGGLTPRCPACPA